MWWFVVWIVVQPTIADDNKALRRAIEEYQPTGIDRSDALAADTRATRERYAGATNRQLSRRTVERPQNVTERF